jgi:hypothetical protein
MGKTTWNPAKAGMPTGQINAHVGDELVMRVGIPETGGKLTSHAFDASYPAMVSASTFWNAKAWRFSIPAACNLYELDMALDSAGFTATRHWAAKGKQPGMAGVFPWGYGAYLELANSVGASWYSQPDLCCEPPVSGSQSETDYRIRATATLLEGCLRIIYDWQNELAKESSPSVVANLVRPPVPVIQGWSADDYKRSLELLMEVWQRWTPWLAMPALIGVGSVCRRNLDHPKHGLYAILSALETEVPKESKLHLFGIKGSALDKVKMMPMVASCDSMAYDFGARVKARQAGRPNSVGLRSQEMTEWMSAAAKRLKPAAGDQFRLEFA